MSRIKTRKGLLSTGLLLMGLTIALGSLAVGYGLWSKTLLINGIVKTGEVNAALSVEETDESADFNGMCPDGGYSIGKDCDNADGDNDPATGLDDQMEMEGKDVAWCGAFLIDNGQSPDQPSPGAQHMQVNINGGYPSFNCFIRWNVENNGTIPIKIHHPVYENFAPAALHVNGWPPDCYDDDTQLEPGEAAFCNLHIHVEQPAAMGEVYGFQLHVCAHQWNEEPGDPAACTP